MEGSNKNNQNSQLLISQKNKQTQNSQILDTIVFRNSEMKPKFSNGWIGKYKKIYIIIKQKHYDVKFWKEVFEEIIEFKDKAIEIQIQQKQEEFKMRLVKHLSNIKMSNLKSLLIEKSNLSNVEFIHLCDFPNLKHLNLIDNKITNIQTLIKCFTYNPIQLLQIDKNPITSLTKNQTVRRIQFERQKKIGRFGINWFNISTSKITDKTLPIIQDYVYCIPFQVKAVSSFSTNDSRQISQKKLLHMISSKLYPKLLTINTGCDVDLFFQRLLYVSQKNIINS